MTNAPTVEAVQQTLAEYERLAISTGEWDGTDAPEFSEDGQTWIAAWLPTREVPIGAPEEGGGVPVVPNWPLLCRVTVHRKGVAHPTTVVVRWDEAVPAIEEWLKLWLRKPIALFGAFTIRAALRRAFRDVIGDRHEPDESTGPAPEAVVDERDWFGDLAAAKTVEEVSELHQAAKRARIITVPLDTEFRRRFRDLGAGNVTPPEPARSRPVPMPPKVRPEDTVRKPRRPRGK